MLSEITSGLYSSYITFNVLKYTSQSRWSSPISTIKIQVIACPESRSFGDLLRELDGKQILQQQEFLLIRGDLVGWVDIPELISRHK